MNEAQRKILVTSLFILVVVCAGLSVAAFKFRGDPALFFILASVSLVGALYLRAGGKPK